MSNSFIYKANKNLGQHFLNDNNILKKLVAHLQLAKTDNVLEIGPGQGALTKLLLPTLNSLQVIDIDRRSIHYLQQKFSEHNLIAYCQDILQFDLNKLSSSTKWRIVGNLPYNISSPILFHCLGQIEKIYDMLFVLQKEMVDRIVSQPNCKTYGRLSVMVQYFCEVSVIIKKISATSFTPPPKVNSAAIYLKPKTQSFIKAQNEMLFSKTVALAFNQRRKTLRNALSNLITDNFWQQTAISGQLRAENLSLSTFIQLSNEINEFLTAIETR